MAGGEDMAQKLYGGPIIWAGAFDHKLEDFLQTSR